MCKDVTTYGGGGGPEHALLRTKGFCGASGKATARGVNLYEDMVAACYKKRQQATQAVSKTDEDLKHVVSTACRPRVFQIALFKGFPNISHIERAMVGSNSLNAPAIGTFSH